MKTNGNMKRLSALILAGSIAVLTASADTTTLATDKPATKHHLTVGNASTARKFTPPATTGRERTSTNTEPDRIYDLRTRNFIDNPDYHEPPRPAPAKQSGRATEPRWIFNARTRNFEINPDYRDPAGAAKGTRRLNHEAEPDRVYDLETRNFEPNPLFGFRW